MIVYVAELPVEEILKTILSLAVTFAVGLIGVRFGAMKLRSERAFDRRLEWYETVVRELSEYRSAFYRFSLSARRGDGVDVLEARWKLAMEAVMKVRQRSVEGRMYATERAHAMLAKLADGAGGLVRNADVETTYVERRFPSLSEDLILEHLRLITSTYMVLTDEARAHLGLSKLRLFRNNDPLIEQLQRRLEILEGSRKQ